MGRRSTLPESTVQLLVALREEGLIYRKIAAVPGGRHSYGPRGGGVAYWRSPQLCLTAA
ncbi:hypothetical protein [Nostocoides sp. F2B08]|uniref:hypothetical protein n=1 Tax=Nostocoides sp. F2B08 TaxID=2653936 RepID=UPI001D05BE02|nr:hypothetical protein [Tetrasphaera sp. F2B08]